MEVPITVLVKIELNDDDLNDPEKGDPLYSRMQESAVEAVCRVVEMGEANGFAHDLADLTSVSVLEVSLCR